MRNSTLGSVLVAISVACLGCGDDGSGTGGTAGTGGSATALSFDADTALPASAGAAAAIAFGTQFGAAMSNLGVFGGLTPRNVQPALAAKGTSSLPNFCSAGGSATLNGFLAVGETVVVTLQNCQGPTLLPGPTSGTIAFEAERVEGGVFRGTVTIDLASPDATIAGSFSVGTNLANLFLGCGLGNVPDCEPAANDIVVTGGRTLRLQCFEIYQRYPEFFRPLALATLGGEIYTINDYQGTIANISLSPTGVPIAGTVQLISGVGPGAGGTQMPCFNGMPEGDDTSCNLTFNANGCVDIECTYADGASGAQSAFWNDLLDFNLTDASDQPCNAGGAGGTGGSALP